VPLGYKQSRDTPLEYKKLMGWRCPMCDPTVRVEYLSLRLRYVHGAQGAADCMPLVATFLYA